MRAVPPKYLKLNLNTILLQGEAYTIATFEDVSEAKRLKLIEEKVKLLELYNSMVTHDLITPLKCMIRIVGRLVDQVSDSCGGLKLVHDTARMMLGHVLLLLDKQLIEGKNFTPCLEFCNLEKLVDGTLCILRSLASVRNIRLRFTPSTQRKFYLKTDKIRLQQILINLVSNAIKFSFEEQPVDVSCEVTESSVTLTVQDFGVGMSAADLSKVMLKPFFRSEDPMSKQMNVGFNNGLGLYTCNLISGLLGGEIRI